MEIKSKAETYIGFAIRAGKYRVGLNTIQTVKKICLVLICKTTADNTKDKALKIALKHKCQALTTVEKTLEQLTHKENAKVMAITDSSLAKAILDNSKTEFITAQKEMANG